MYSPKAIANALLDMAEKAGKPLTQMKLHKLVYYAHGWNLALTGKPLIDETIEAWKYGPVVRSLYYEFRDVGSQPIPRKAYEFDFVKGTTKFSFTVPIIDANDEASKALMGRVWDVYGGLTAAQLSKMTHESGSPWAEVWTAAQADGVIKGRDIPNNLIQAYFKRKAEVNRAAKASEA
jgi:uncharacterized phage-associated protein